MKHHTTKSTKWFDEIYFQARVNFYFSTRWSSNTKESSTAANGEDEVSSWHDNLNNFLDDVEQKAHKTDFFSHFREIVLRRLFNGFHFGWVYTYLIELHFKFTIHYLIWKWFRWRKSRKSSTYVRFYVLCKT